MKLGNHDGDRSFVDVDVVKEFEDAGMRFEVVSGFPEVLFCFCWVGCVLEHEGDEFFVLFSVFVFEIFLHHISITLYTVLKDSP